MIAAMPVKKPTRRRRWLWSVGIVCCLIGLFIVVVWWTMIRMPGVGYHGELPATDGQLTTWESELRDDVTGLAIRIGERNVGNSPKQLVQAAEYISARFTAAGYEPEFRLSKRLLALMGAKKYPLHCFRQGSQNGEDTHGFYGIVLRRG